MDGSFLEAPVYRYLKCNWRSSSFSRPNCKGQVRSGGHPKGPSGHGCCSDVLPPFSVSNQLLKSNSVSPCGNAIQWQTSSFQILFYVVHPSLLWAPNRSFSCWLPIMNYGWPPLFAHSRDMSIPFHSPFPNSILCYFLPCPDPHLRIAYSIRIFNAQYPTQPSIFACIQLINCKGHFITVDIIPVRPYFVW